MQSVVLVHGAFADATSWQKVIPLLAREGLGVTALQLPLKSLTDDVATAKRLIESQSGDVVLGHLPNRPPADNYSKVLALDDPFNLKPKRRRS